MNTEDIYSLKKSSSDYYKKHHFHEALNSYNELIKQYSNGASKENSIEMCKALHRVGVCHFLLNQYDKAMETFRRFDEIYSKNKFENEPLLGRNMAYMAYSTVVSATSDSDMERGYESAKKARDIFERNKIKEDDDNAVLFSTLGYYHFKKGDYDSAKKELERAEHFIKIHNHRKNMVNMYDLYYLAQIYLKESRIDDAINKFAESHKLSEELNAGDLEYHRTCLENISNLYYKLERDDLAQRFEKKLEEYKQSKQ